MSKEKLEIIEDQGNEGGQKADDEERGTFEKKQRKKKSSIWDGMTAVKFANRTFKLQCNHYIELFIKNTTRVIY